MRSQQILIRRLPMTMTAEEALDLAEQHGGECKLERGPDGTIRGVVVCQKAAEKTEKKDWLT